LIVVGLDAATFDVIDPLVDAGDLPNLGALLQRGARGTLRSTTHPLTPVAWTTMVSGVNAGKHGIWDFSERDTSGYGLRLVNGSHSRAPALWTRLSGAGRRVGIGRHPLWMMPLLTREPESDGLTESGAGTPRTGGRADPTIRRPMGGAMYLPRTRVTPPPIPAGFV